VHDTLLVQQRLSIQWLPDLRCAMIALFADLLA
jgi:hypothetical protein